jgi:general stress protein 26
MSEPVRASDFELKSKIIKLLDENRIMTVATVRPDGWPQATIVGYAHDDLTVYFVVARNSQKLSNIERDPRISIAIGRRSIAVGEARHDRILGLSMAARASEVTDPDQIESLNALVAQQHPGQAVFAPREVSATVMQAMPTIISVIDLSMGPGQPELVYVTRETNVHRLCGTDESHATAERSPFEHAARPS